MEGKLMLHNISSHVSSLKIVMDLSIATQILEYWMDAMTFGCWFTLKRHILIDFNDVIIYNNHNCNIYNIIK